MAVMNRNEDTVPPLQIKGVDHFSKPIASSLQSQIAKQGLKHKQRLLRIMSAGWPENVWTETHLISIAWLGT